MNMKITCRLFAPALSLALFAGGAVLVGAQDSNTSNSPQADNTKMNAGDSRPQAVTADQQKANPSDRDTTRQIRQAIVKDKFISTYGHNVKIITQNGMVTLKGPVRSEDEKKTIEAKAAEIAGPDKVTDDLEVKTKQ
ncbi:MAG: BON domain-containing protein [Candidatus Sulfotelmatobacter sp.]